MAELAAGTASLTVDTDERARRLVTDSSDHEAVFDPLPFDAGVHSRRTPAAC
jgi:hypothetical protein